MEYNHVPGKFPLSLKGEKGVKFPNVVTPQLGQEPFTTELVKVEHSDLCLTELDSMNPDLVIGDQEAMDRIYLKYTTKFSEEGNALFGHIAILALRIKMYMELEPPNGFHFRPADYLYYSLRYGPSFAELLKKIRQAAAITTLSSRLTQDTLKYVEELKNNDLKIAVNLEQKWDYDSFLNERFLIDFIETGSDLPWAFEPLEENVDSLDSFREAARSMLRTFKVRDIEVPGPEVMGTWINDSITPTDDGAKVNRTLLREYARDKRMEELTSIRPDEPMKFKRSLVPVGPANLRDTWQCKPSTLFAVKRISFLLRQVLEDIPYSAMGRPYKVIQRRKILKRDNVQYLMFDYKKCGLTVNRNLICILADELSILYPGKGFEEMKRFANIELQNGTETLHPIRGVGLGNCNEGVTLIQCVVGHIFKKMFDIDSIFFNDDGVFVLPEKLVYRRFTQIGTFLKGIGMILNLKKTIISDCNIFCEDYIIAEDKEVDYSKTQLSILPFAQCFFERNIVTAKSLFNSLQRGLIGKRVESDSLLPSLVNLYGFEFHKEEVFWPFEIGGWKYLGNTSCNEVVTFIFGPGRYMTSCSAQGAIPITKEWCHYLVNHDKLTGLVRAKGNIPYRGFVENPFKDPLLKAPQSELAEEFLHSLGLETNQEKICQRDDLYNYRGLKNAKPRIRRGLADKRLQTRKSIWRSFKLFRLRVRNTFYPSWYDIITVLNYMRRGDTLPMYYTPPVCLIDGWKPFSSSRKKGRYMIPRVDQRRGNGSQEGFNFLTESVIAGHWKMGSDLYAGYDYFISSRDRSIISDIDLHVPQEEYIPPDYIYLFLPSKRYALIILNSIFKMNPSHWVDMGPVQTDISKVINPLETIFPQHHNAWKRIRRSYEKHNASANLREILLNLSIMGEDESLLILSMLREELNSILEERRASRKTEEPPDIPPEIYILDEDDALADQLLGERDELDLIDEFEEEFEYGSDAPTFEDDPFPTYLGDEEEFDEFYELDRISVHSAVSLPRE